MPDGGASDEEDAGGGGTKKAAKNEVRIDPVHDTLIDVLFQNTSKVVTWSPTIPLGASAPRDLRSPSSTSTVLVAAGA